MKTYKILVVLLLSFIGFSTINEAKSQDVDVNFSLFQQELSPYGRWVNTPNYGAVWIYNEPGFEPYYTNGYWDYTDDGWYWNSSYDWGWVTFHYGRWEQDPYYGWVWIPGYDWAPAWVAWSENPDYYGWAPLGYGLGLNIGINTIPRNRWIFAPRQYITSRNIRQYGFNGSRNPNVFRNATIINYGRNDRYMRGPQRTDVERYTHTQIQPRRIENYGRSGRSGNVFNGNDRNRNYNFGSRGNNASQDRRNDQPQDRRIGTPNIDRGNNNAGRSWSQQRGDNNQGSRTYGNSSPATQTPPADANRRIDRSGGFGNRGNDANQQGRGGWNSQRQWGGNNNADMQRRSESAPQAQPQQRSWGGSNNAGMQRRTESAPQSQSSQPQQRNWGGERQMQQRSDGNTNGGNSNGGGREARHRG